MYKNSFSSTARTQAEEQVSSTIDQSQVWADIVNAMTELISADSSIERKQRLTFAICSNLNTLTDAKVAFAFQSHTIGFLLKNLPNIPSFGSIRKIIDSLNECMKLMIPANISAVPDIDAIVIDDALNKIPETIRSSKILKQIWHERGAYILHLNSKLKEMVTSQATLDRNRPSTAFDKELAKRVCAGLDVLVSSMKKDAAPPASLVSTLVNALQLFTLDRESSKETLVRTMRKLVRCLSTDIDKKNLQFSSDELISMIRGLRHLAVNDKIPEIASLFRELVYYLNKAHQQGVKFYISDLPKVMSGIRLLTGIAEEESTLLRAIFTLYEDKIIPQKYSITNGAINQVCSGIRNLDPSLEVSQMIYEVVAKYLVQVHEKLCLDNWSIFHLVNCLKQVSGATAVEGRLIATIQQILYRHRINYPGHYDGPKTMNLTSNALGGIAVGLRSMGSAPVNDESSVSIQMMIEEVCHIFENHDHVPLDPLSIVNILSGTSFFNGKTSSEIAFLEVITKMLHSSIEKLDAVKLEEHKNQLVEVVYRSLATKSLNLDDDGIIARYMSTMIKLIERAAQSSRPIQLTNSQLLFTAEGLTNMTGRYPQELFFIDFYCDLIENRQHHVTNGNVIAAIAYSMRFMEGYSNIERRFFDTFARLIDASKSNIRLEKWGLASVCSCIRGVSWITVEYAQLVQVLAALIQSSHSSKFEAKDIPLALSGLRVRANSKLTDDEKAFFKAVLERLTSFASNSNHELTAYDISDILHRADNVSGSGSMEERQVISLIVNLTAPYTSSVKLSSLQLARAVEGLKAISLNNSEEESLIYVILKFIVNSDVEAFANMREVGFVCSGLRNLSGTSANLTALIDRLAVMIENSAIRWSHSKTMGVACLGVQSMSCDDAILSPSNQSNAEQRFVSAIVSSISQSIQSNPIRLSEHELAFCFLGMRSMSGRSAAAKSYIRMLIRLLESQDDLVVTLNQQLQDVFTGIANLETFSSSSEASQLLEQLIILIDRSLKSPHLNITIIGCVFSDICFALKNITSRSTVELAFIAKVTELLNTTHRDQDEMRIIPAHICRGCYGIRNLTGDSVEERALLIAMRRYIHINRFFEITPDLMNQLLEGCARLNDQHEEVINLKTTIKEVFSETIHQSSDQSS
jgi:hypothetical protein